MSFFRLCSISYATLSWVSRQRVIQDPCTLHCIGDQALVQSQMNRIQERSTQSFYDQL